MVSMLNIILEKSVGGAAQAKTLLKSIGCTNSLFHSMGECLLLPGRSYFPPRKNLKISPETPL